MNRNTVNFRAEKAGTLVEAQFLRKPKVSKTIQYVLKVSNDRSIDIDAPFLPPQRVPSLVGVALTRVLL